MLVRLVAKAGIRNQLIFIVDVGRELEDANTDEDEECRRF